MYLQNVLRLLQMSKKPSKQYKRSNPVLFKTEMTSSVLRFRDCFNHFLSEDPAWLNKT